MDNGANLAGSLQLEAIVRRVAEGDHCAVASLYDATSRLIYGLILRILRNAETAEEVLLDVYTQVWRQAHLYDSSRGSPLAWMITIARSRAINRLRSGELAAKFSAPIENANNIESSYATPEDSTAMLERKNLVRSAVQELSSDQRQVIELAYYAGLSHSEIAVRLSQPLGTVKTRIRLGMMKLRERLSGIVEVNHGPQR